MIQLIGSLKFFILYFLHWRFVFSSFKNVSINKVTIEVPLDDDATHRFI